MEKKKKNVFGRIFIVLFIMFLCLYTASIFGYTARGNEYKSFYTKEMIEKFEQDVESGEYIDINNYLNYDEKDYSNRFSNLGVSVGNAIEKLSDKVLNFLSNLFSYLFE